MGHPYKSYAHLHAYLFYIISPDYLKAMKLKLFALMRPNYKFQLTHQMNSIHILGCPYCKSWNSKLKLHKFYLPWAGVITPSLGNYAIPFIFQMRHSRQKICYKRYTSISKLGAPLGLIFPSYSFHSWDKGYGVITQARHNYPSPQNSILQKLVPLWKC